MKYFKYFCVFMASVMVLRSLYTGYGARDAIMTAVFWLMVYTVPYSIYRFTRWMRMKDIFVVMVNDRHVDPHAYLFSSKGAAVDCAMRKVGEMAAYPEDAEYMDDKGLEKLGLLFQCVYSIEGDAVWVYQVEVDKQE